MNSRLHFLAAMPLLALSLAAADPEPAKAPAPAPAVDRVGFPTDYRAKFKVLRVVDRSKEGKVVTVYGNEPASSVLTTNRLPYPNGSVIVMETATVAKDPDGKAVTDAKGAPVRDQVTGMHVVRRGKDFGREYGKNRSGEWEFAEYKPDGSYITPPAQSAACAECHIKAGAAKDFVYQARLGH